MIRILAIWMVWLYARLFYRHRVYGKEHVVATRAIYAANHASFLDPPLLGSSCPYKIRFLARSSLFHVRWCAWVLGQLEAYPIERGGGNLEILRTMIASLKEGKNIALFPEGRRSDDGRLQPALPGIGMLVVRSQAVVVPVYIHGTYAIWNRHRSRPKLFTKEKTACIFGSPLYFTVGPGTSKEMQAQIGTQIMEAIHNLELWYRNGAQGSPP